MPATATTVIDWAYEPKDFFEEKCSVAFADGSIAIEDGLAIGEFGGSYYADASNFRDAAHAQLEAAFLAQQVHAKRPYSLKGSSIALKHADGRQDISVFFAETLSISFAISSADFVHFDGNGNVVQDTKADRLKEQAQFREDVARLLPSDPTLRRMLQSFRNALNDRENLLIHLFEIREALGSALGGEKAVRETVGVTERDWRKFGVLANNAPLLEGRHRGKHSDLRAATQAEVTWSLDFAQSVIDGYIQSRRETVAQATKDAQTER